MAQYGNSAYEKQKNVNQDAKSERIMDAFLVNKVYPEFLKIGIAKKIETVTDKELQKNGIDAIWTLDDGTTINFDNKNRASVLNAVSRAVPFEIRTCDTDGENRHDGWFTSLSKEIAGEKMHLTDYIMFIHPYSKNPKETNFNNIGINDIKEIDMLLVRVDEVFKYLSDYYHLSYKEIYETALKFDEEFTEKTEDMDFIPGDMRKCSTGFEKGMRTCVNRKEEEYTSYDAVIHTSINSYMDENPTNLLILEDVCKVFPHTRHFHYSVYRGLSEYYDIKERREFSKRS